MRTKMLGRPCARDTAPGDVFCYGDNVYLRVSDRHLLLTAPELKNGICVAVVELTSGELVQIGAGAPVRPVNGVFEEE